MPRALITGVTGQDGSYLAEFLLAKGYEVHGITRRSSSINTTRIQHLYQHPREAGTRFFLHYGDMSDAASLRHIVGKVKPDEIYNLAAQSHVRVSFDEPTYTSDVVAHGTLRLLEALRDEAQATGRAMRFYQAGSSEMFGAAPAPQNEATPFHPRSPYGVAKVAAHWHAINYREAYDLFICNGILFNHESPRRGEAFVTRKVTLAVGRIVAGVQDVVYLGNLEARRDWGFAGDYVEAMWMMLQADKPDDYVIATGEDHTVREFVDAAFGCAGLASEDYIKFDEYYLRPTEVDQLRGDATRARTILGWKPRVKFDALVKMMVDADITLAESERASATSGPKAGAPTVAW